MKKCQKCGYVGDAGESFCSPCYRNTKKFLELVREDSPLFGRASDVLGARFIYSETFCGSCDSELVGSEIVALLDSAVVCLVCYMNGNGLTARTFSKILKSAIGCEVCGFSKSAFALQYDHTNPLTKKRNAKTGKPIHPSDLFRSCSAVVFAVEVMKCRITCANCHAIKTARERGLE